MYSSVIYEASAAFPEEKIPDVSYYYEDIISQCSDIFSGAPPWQYVKRSGLYGAGERKLASLNAAKALCDTLSDMVFGQQVDIRLSDKEKEKYVMDVLQKNCFWERMPELFSYAFALGGAAVKVFISGGKVMLDYISAENFVPTGMNSRCADEGIFRSKSYKNGRFHTLMESHSKDKNGNTAVRFRLFASENSSSLGTEVPVQSVFPSLKGEIAYPFSQKMFSYFRPAVSNNILSDTALGLSVFYNCRDTLKALDIAFDSFMREFILGRKRIIVPSSCIRTVVDPETGGVRRYFDADDEVYQALRCEDEKELKITDNTVTLRISEHVEAINALLNILCFQTGLSSGSLSFGSSSGVRTAAEIASQENRSARTTRANRNIAAEFIENLIRSILAAGDHLGEINGADTGVTVSFSKELDVSVDKTIDRNLKLMDSGIISEREAKEIIMDKI